MMSAQTATLPMIAPMIAPAWEVGWGGGVDIGEELDDAMLAEEETVLDTDEENVEELDVASGRATLGEEGGRQLSIL